MSIKWMVQAKTENVSELMVDILKVTLRLVCLFVCLLSPWFVHKSHALMPPALQSSPAHCRRHSQVWNGKVH